MWWRTFVTLAASRRGLVVGLEVVAALLVAGAVVAATPHWWLRLPGAALRLAARSWPVTGMLTLAAVVLAAAIVLRGPGPVAWVPGVLRSGALRLRLLPHVALLLGLAFAIAVAVGWVLWAALGQPPLASGPASMSPSPPAPNPGWTVSNTFDGLKIVLAVVGGIGAVVALTVAYRRQHLGESAERREETKLFTDRFTKAAELLGSGEAAVRLAGVYAMGALADDWAGGRQTCIDVLCAYLRMPYIPPSGAARLTDPASAETGPASGESIEAGRDPREEREVRHTVIRLIRDRLRRTAATTWQGYDFDFTGAIFDGGQFNGAVFSGGQVSFDRSVFSGGAVSFDDAVFSGGAVSFHGAVFSGGAVSFRGAVFSGGAVSFSFAAFSGGQAYFGGAAFSGSAVSFHRARLSGGVVSFAEATFAEGVMSFGGAEFSGGDLSFGGAAFLGGRLSLDSAEFSAGSASFDGATFAGGVVYFGVARLSGGRVSFDGAVFAGGDVDLSGVRGWRVPPTFDTWPEGPPKGLRLPSEAARGT